MKSNITDNERFFASMKGSERKCAVFCRTCSCGGVFQVYTRSCNGFIRQLSNYLSGNFYLRMYTGCRKNDCYKKQDGKRNTYRAAFKSHEVQRLLNVNRFCHIVKKLGQKFKAEWIIIQDQQFYVHYTF